VSLSNGTLVATPVLRLVIESDRTMPVSTGDMIIEAAEANKTS
jgi:hypothetical protein